MRVPADCGVRYGAASSGTLIVHLAIPIVLSLGCASDTSTDTDPTTAADGGVDSTVHELLIAPYVQVHGPDDAWVMWETATGDESTVEFGLSEDSLGFTATGSAQAGGVGRLHTVRLDSLLADTPFYYRVRTGGMASDTQRFRTPPEPGTAGSWQLVAVSDMQRDDSHPDKWAEIVSEGILPVIAERYGAEPSDALGLVLVAGDLVDNGWLASDWQDDFFAGAAPLMGQVPMLAVPGNHEGSSPLFFSYFVQPDNGTPGRDEYWWWRDHGRVRVIGLDSNLGGWADEQLGWLDTVLADTCTDDGVDFVFAELHHPALSELWTPGEDDFSAQAVARLERFTTACGKPSVHFFGHTHGYSRGQSRDHRHLWVNVATAGGAIDRWNVDDAADYDQMTVTQAEYGFVAVEVEPTGFTLRRVSRGTPESPRDNEITDQVRIDLEPDPPADPTGLVASWDNATLTLGTDPFSHPGDGQHGASHWQISADCETFSAPVVDSWQQHQNWFFDVDQAAGIDLTALTTQLAASGMCWRVRHRDRGLAWSEWSSATIP